MVLQIYSAIYLLMHTCIMASTFSLRRLMSRGINGRQCGNNVRRINKHRPLSSCLRGRTLQNNNKHYGRFITTARMGWLRCFSTGSHNSSLRVGIGFPLFCLPAKWESNVCFEMSMSYIGAARQQRVSEEVFLSAEAMINSVELTRHLKSLGAELLIGGNNYRPRRRLHSTQL